MPYKNGNNRDNNDLWEIYRTNESNNRLQYTFAISTRTIASGLINRSRPASALMGSWRNDKNYASSLLPVRTLLNKYNDIN